VVARPRAGRAFLELAADELNYNDHPDIGCSSVIQRRTRSSNWTRFPHTLQPHTASLNHLAFRLESEAVLASLIRDASENGWSALPGEHHPIAGGGMVAYLEDRDVFEVELVAPRPD
jgi:hypothetical protein